MKKRLQKILLACVVPFIGFQGFSQGLIIIESDTTGTGSLIIDSVSANHLAQVQRFVQSGNWHIISSPVADQALGEFGQKNSIVFNNTVEDYDLAPYDEIENSWTPYTKETNTNTFEIARAYSTRRSAVGSLVFSGVVNVGEFTFPVTRNVDSYGWNGIGNPYTSPILTVGTNGFFASNRTVFDNSFRALYIWDQSINDYSVLLETSLTVIPETKDTLGFNGIAVGQGFVIKAQKDTVVTFNREMQIHINEFDVPFKSAEIPWSLIKLNVDAGSMKNSAHFAFNSEMTKDLNPGFDVGKLKGNPRLALYSGLLEEGNEVDFAIQSLPNYNFDEYRIPIGLDFTGSGIINFTAQTLDLPIGMEVILEDVEEKTFTKLNTEDASYITTIQNGSSGYGRFYLLTSNTLVSTESELKQNDLGAFIYSGKIYFKGEIEDDARISLYSVDGKLWYNNSIQNMNERSISIEGFPAGVYLLHVNQKNARETIKLVHSGVGG